MGDGSGLAELADGLTFGLSSLGLSVSALVDPVRLLSGFRGVVPVREVPGVERARCNWLGRDRGLVESRTAWPEVSMVRFRFRRRSNSRPPLAISLAGDMGDRGKSEKPRVLRGRLWVSPEKRRMLASLSMAETGAEELELLGECRTGRAGRPKWPLGTRALVSVSPTRLIHVAACVSFNECRVVAFSLSSPSEVSLWLGCFSLTTLPFDPSCD